MKNGSSLGHGILIGVGIGIGFVVTGVIHHVVGEVQCGGRARW